jgi:hypothetical protein
MAIEEWAKLWVQSSRSFIIFWATMFMTSTLGIVRLLSDFDQARLKLGYYYGFTALYLFFLLLSSLSVYSVLSNYRTNRRFSIDGNFGERIRDIAINNSTIMDYILSEKGGYMRGWIIYLWILPEIFYGALFILKLRNI